MHKVKQEWAAKLQSEVTQLQQRATASMAAATAQHAQALAAQQAQHEQQVQKLQAEHAGLQQAKHSVQSQAQKLGESLEQAQGQIKALQESMHQQSQDAQHTLERQSRQHESARLSQQHRHSGEIAALTGEHQTGMEAMQQDLIQQEQVMEDRLAELTGQHSILERRFNARSVSLPTSLVQALGTANACERSVPNWQAPCVQWQAKWCVKGEGVTFWKV